LIGPADEGRLPRRGFGGRAAAVLERSTVTGLVRPKDVVAGFLAAWNRHDARALAALFAEQAEFVSAAGLWGKSRAEIEAGYRRLYASAFRAGRLEGQVVSVKRLRPDVATVHLAWELTGEAGPDGAPVAPRTGLLLLVLSEGDQGWRVQVAQATASPPGVRAPPARG
jgi:uncharacterized protein (TIGR02246 family)